jgi:4'-phosphopantetheinyl transferase
MWRAPDSFPELSPNKAHCWRADLSALHDGRDWNALLSPDEQTRAARFHFGIDRARFTCARGVLRTLLGSYLQRAPHELQFAYNAHGKPELQPKLQRESATRVLRFNVSHSRELALFAFALEHAIGVDIEFVREDWSGEYLLQLATRFFHARECEMLGKLEGDTRREKFFELWTRKEAITKARGDGLWQGLDFDVTEVLDGWTQFDFAPATNFTGALAVQTREMQTEFWEFCDSEFLPK